MLTGRSKENKKKDDRKPMYRRCEGGGRRGGDAIY
jgi:hypothetical protein